ncbi:uncharacterized protein LOC129754948 [Uranotaenia lowii]|uniref:uncharacterized protein LOC129754948 n=1 Tax=Uranotaenia lowii TaxID=190385 RepID=UPI00247B1F5B|nr:uncharacterized protein LOC129754948 [Uranotaenia lowii]
MARFAFVIFALCLLQVSLARVARDAPVPAEENTFLKTLTDFGTKIQEAVSDTQQNILKSLGFHSNEEVIETIKTNTNKYVEQLKSIQTNFAEQFQTASDPIVRDLNKRITETTKTLSEQNPEAFQKAKDFQEAIQGHIQGFVTEAQKVGERLKEEGQGTSEQLQAGVKQLLDATVQHFQKMTNELKAPEPAS